MVGSVEIESNLNRLSRSRIWSSRSNLYADIGQKHLFPTTCIPLQDVVAVSFGSELDFRTGGTRHSVLSTVDVRSIGDDGIHKSRFPTFLGNSELQCSTTVLPHSRVEVNDILLASLKSQLLHITILYITLTIVDSFSEVTTFSEVEYTGTTSIGSRISTIFRTELYIVAVRDTTLVADAEEIGNKLTFSKRSLWFGNDYRLWIGSFFTFLQRAESPINGLCGGRSRIWTCEIATASLVFQSKALVCIILNFPNGTILNILTILIVQAQDKATVKAAICT